MSLQPGDLLLHFRLVEKIGEGGMGQVWRAIDGTLDREIAIKVLPAEFAHDPDRLARFEREAKLLASLNHPNIATIHGLHEARGLRFLAMELVRGEDLAQILGGGPLSIGEALDAARQIAAALEAAHDNGVVHRDLKPANVKRTPEGKIKVLDFGLAKALEVGGLGSGQSATVTSAGSRAGIILGTASYMSPEQARAQNVDRRTDLWAYGCLLYEMLTGAKAFDGPTVTDVLAAVVTGEPDWSKLPASTPASVRRLLRRCLEKHARKRLRDAGDASLLLDDNPADAITAPVPVAPPARSSLLVPAALAIALAGLAGGWWIAHRPAPAKATPLEFHRVTYSRGMVRAARFAPDGHTIAFGAAWGGPPTKLYLARTDSAESTPLATPPAELLSISKTGEMAVALGLTYYGWMGEGTLARAPLLGGAPREILEHVRSADWSPDGAQLAIVRTAQGSDQLEYPPGKVLDTTTGYFEQIRISPDGRRIAYIDHPAWGDNLGGVAVVDLSGKKTSLASGFPAIQGLAWAPGGREIWFSALEDNRRVGILAIDLEGHRRTVYTGPSFLELHDIAPDGRVLVGLQRQDRDGQALLAGYKEPQPLVVAGETSIVRALSADGRTVLVVNQLADGYETFAIRSDRPGAVRITAGESVAISRDGTLAITSTPDYRSFTLTPLGMGTSRPIPNPDGLRYLSVPSWLPDGRRFILVGQLGSDPSRGFAVDVNGGKARAFAAPGTSWIHFTSPPVSPDGKFAVLADVDGVMKRWPIDGGESLEIRGLHADDQPIAWSDDGGSLFVAGRSFPIPISRVDLASGQRTPVMTLAPTDPAGMRYVTPVITPDGKHWALGTAKMLSDVYVVEGLK